MTHLVADGSARRARILPAPQRGRSAAVRRFTPEHIPAVVRLRRAMFGASERRDDAALAAHYLQVFFNNPWYDPSMPSLVLEEGGRTVGFIGVIPRPFVWRGDAIRAAASTEFMVDPDCRGGAAILLLQAFLRSGQDLSLADRANERARLLIEAAGGRTALWFSLYWTLPIRPLQHTLAQVPASAMLRPVLGAARRATAVIERLGPSCARWRGPGCIEPLAVDEVAEELPTLVTGRCELYPRYDGRSLRWLLDRVAEKTSVGTLDAFQLREGKQLVGWCVILVRRRGRAEVVQWVARADHHRSVLECAIQRARERGAITLAGRLDPLFAPVLAELGVQMTLARPLTVVHARRAELLHAVSEGRALLSRLDGEWWLST